MVVSRTLVLPGIILPSVAKRDAKGIETLPECPRVARNYERTFFFWLHLDLHASNTFADTPVDR